MKVRTNLFEDAIWGSLWTELILAPRGATASVSLPLSGAIWRTIHVRIDVWSTSVLLLRHVRDEVSR